MAIPRIVLLPDPRFMEWKPWVDTVTGYNAGLFSEADENMEWHEFGDAFCRRFPQAPTPEGFEAWQDWAIAVKLALQV